MRFYVDSVDGKIEFTEGLGVELSELRRGRNFNVVEYVDRKIEKIVSYFDEYGLDTAVVALSGGVDSAVVYALLKKVQALRGDVLKNVVALTLPVYETTGVTNQLDTRNRAKELTDSFGDRLFEIDLSMPHVELCERIEGELGIVGGDWARGQVASYLRTPAYYYVTSLLMQGGGRPVFCGTTNRDEGAYLGYFGKASDGMVDLQLISDIHKSEVFEVAKYLGVVDVILDAVPTGDMYDNRSDEEVFGAPYDFVELYLLLKERGCVESCKSRLGGDDIRAFEVFQKNVEDLHRFNKHKYLGCSPAVHLDVIEARIKGGWKYFVYEGDETNEGE